MVTLNGQPYKFAWAKNKNSFSFHCSDIHSAGGLAEFIYEIYYIGIDGQHLVINIDGRKLTWTFGSDSDDEWCITSVADACAKLARCYYLTSIFDISYVSVHDIKTITFTTQNNLNYGYHTLDLYYTTATGERFSESSAPDFYMCTERRTGMDIALLPNYSLAISLEVVVNDYNNVRTFVSDNIFYQPDDEGNVTVWLDSLKSYIPQPDIPGVSDLGNTAYILTNGFIKYRLRYAEVYGETPLMQRIYYTGYFYAFCGEEVEYYSRLNLPDWKDPNPTEQLSTVSGTNNNLFRSIGEDTGKVFDLHKNQPEFIYMFWYNSDQAIGNTVTMKIRVTRRNTTATGTQSTYVITIKNGDIYRLAVGPKQVSAEDYNFYDIEVMNVNNVVQFSRRYRVIPDYYQKHFFLLRNRYGLLNGFAAKNMSVKMETSGDGILMDGRYYVDLKETKQIYVAKSPAMKKNEAVELARSLSSDYQYYLANNAWQRITVEPGSIEYINDNEDMVVVEFSFRFVENQIENIATNDARSSSNTTIVENIVDSAGKYVSYGTRIAQSINLIHS